MPQIPSPATLENTPSDSSTSTKVSRREFLNYVWGASIALLLAESGGAALWFALPHRQLGKLGGYFRISADNLPQPGGPPIAFPEGDFWLVNTSEGLLALNGICTYRGCRYKWVPTNW